MARRMRYKGAWERGVVSRTVEWTMIGMGTILMMYALPIMLLALLYFLVDPPGASPFDDPEMLALAALSACLPVTLLALRRRVWGGAKAGWRRAGSLGGTSSATRSAGT